MKKYKDIILENNILFPKKVKILTSVGTFLIFLSLVIILVDPIVEYICIVRPYKTIQYKLFELINVENNKSSFFVLICLIFIGWISSLTISNHTLNIVKTDFRQLYTLNSNKMNIKTELYMLIISLFFACMSIILIFALPNIVSTWDAFNGNDNFVLKCGWGTYIIGICFILALILNLMPLSLLIFKVLYKKNIIDETIIVKIFSKLNGVSSISKDNVDNL